MATDKSNKIDGLRDMVQSESIVLNSGDSSNDDIMSLLAAKGWIIRSDCGGRGLCGKCRVKVSSPANVSKATDAELRLLSAADLDSGFRLACQAQIKGQVGIVVSTENFEPMECLGKTDLKGNFSVDPVIRRIAVSTDEKFGNGQRDILSSLKDSLGNIEDAECCDSSVLTELSFLWGPQSSVTLVNHTEKGITRILPGEQLRSLGFAVDIGTTTIAGYLCDLRTGEILASAGCANPQRQFGEDVISRIAYASRDRGVNRLREPLLLQINLLIEACIKKAKAGSSDIDEVVAVGNTTMQHLFCGLNPKSLGRSPYRPVTCSSTDWRASEFKLSIDPYANVHVFPVISGFVGGDAIGATISQDFDMGNGQVLMIVDIGTNGEVVISRDGRLWATSCATGPALEGAHITSGMRAASGAIDRISIDSTDFKVSYNFLGQENGARPKGICGSGIIDAVAEMRRVDLIFQNGRLNESIPGVETDAAGIGQVFTLVKASETSDNRPVIISLNDIRQIQLAKAAMATGIKLLMDAAGCNRVDRLILTGAFGARFDWRNAVAIGMLPLRCVAGVVEIVENAAGLGAVAALLDHNYRERAIIVGEKTEIIELSKHPRFLEEFTSALDFPALL